jgi:hypothetical protein
VVKRALKVAIIILLLAGLAVALFLCIERVHGTLALKACRREFIAEGINMTPRGFLPASSDKTNGALAITEAVSKFPKASVLARSSPPRMILTEDGYGVPGYQQEKWDDMNGSNSWDQAAAELEQNRLVLDQARSGFEQPVIETPLDFTQGPMMKFPLLPCIKPLSRWFSAGTALELRRKDTHRAAEYLRAQILLPRTVSRDRTVITEIVRTSTEILARFSTWDALQADGWSDEDLASIQQAWEQQHFALPMCDAFEAEIGDLQTGLDLLHRSNDNAFTMLYGMEEYFPVADSERPAWERVVRRWPSGDRISRFIEREIYCQIWRFAWLDQYECRYLTDWDKVRGLMKSAAREKSYQIAAVQVVELESIWANRSLYDRLRYPNSGSPFKATSMIERALRAETERSIALCAVAIKRFELRHGRLPDKLEVMVPEFLEVIPVDWMDGKAIRYRPLSGGGFVLYSVGSDGADNGGDSRIVPGIVTKNGWERRDFLWPMPAPRSESAER